MIGKQYQEITVHLYEMIDSIYPFYKAIMSEFDCFTSLKFMQKYPHPDYVISHREKTLIKDFKELTGHGDKYAYSLPEFFDDCKEPKDFLEKFMDYCHIIKKPIIEEDLFV